MNIGFERIHPVPEYPPGTSLELLRGIPWSSRRDIVNFFKSELKTSLRECQLGRCCFCRRLMFDDYATHLEHFLDQASHPDFRYEIRNLALSCGTCNIKKNGYFASWTNRYRRLNKHVAVPTPTFRLPLPAGAPFPAAAADFRWVNPYIHTYSEHISIQRGWVFQGKTRQGRRTIRGLRLNELADIERRALTERLASRGGVLSTLVGALYEANQHRRRDIAEAVVKVINRRRLSGTT